ncbi:MAG: hypothetical protein J6W50_01395, partial [Bacteroidaceae bacterium]|nr:hypothetical protein [Bacteroidaceae bacterium]
AHYVELALVAVHICLCFYNLAFLLRNGTVKLAYLVFYALYARAETFYLGLLVFHFERQLATQCFFLIDGRQGRLQLVEGFQALFYRQVCRIFLCHFSFI